MVFHRSRRLPRRALTGCALLVRWENSCFLNAVQSAMIASRPVHPVRSSPIRRTAPRFFLPINHPASSAKTSPASQPVGRRRSCPSWGSTKSTWESPRFLTDSVRRARDVMRACRSVQRTPLSWILRHCIYRWWRKPVSGVECVKWSVRRSTTMVQSEWCRHGIWQGSIHDGVTPTRSFSRQSQFATSNQFTLDFVPPLFIYIHGSVA